MSRYEHLLRHYAAMVGLDPVDLLLTTQEIEIDDLIISLMLDGNENLGDIVFCANLGVPDARLPTARLHELMLQANALWAGTRGCTLGLQYGSGAVVLAGRTPLPLCHVQGLADALGSFTDIAKRWTAFISDSTFDGLPALHDSDAAATPTFA